MYLLSPPNEWGLLPCVDFVPEQQLQLQRLIQKCCWTSLLKECKPDLDLWPPCGFFPTQMKAFALQQTNVAHREQQPSPCGRSLSSNYAPQNLENKILAQRSTLIAQPCSLLLNPATQPSSSPFLQPSSLSSTTSSLLRTSSCSSSLTSPLLSTENKLLSSHSLLTSPSFLTSVTNDHLVSTSITSPALVDHFAPDENGEESNEVMQSCLGETSTVNKALFVVIFYSIV